MCSLRDPGMQQAGLDTASLLLHEVPGLGSLLGGADALTGCDYIANRQASTGQRVMGGLQAITPIGAGDEAEAEIEAAARSSAPREFHHLFPQAGEFAGQWDRLGIDIDDYVVSLDKAFHQEELHGYPRGNGGWWNQQWRDFFASNPEATAKQAFNQMLDMVEHCGIGDKKIFRYPYAGKY